MRYLWAAIDFAVLILFVAIGRSTHDHAFSIAGMTSTLWPFTCGLLIGWIGLLARRRSGMSIMDGLILSCVTVTVGMILRVVSGQGTAVPFIVVAVLFLGALMVGWRGSLAGVRYSRTRRNPL